MSQSKKQDRAKKLDSFDKFMQTEGSEGIFGLTSHFKRKKRKRKQNMDIPLKLYRQIAFGFIILTGALLIFMLVFSATSATVTLTPTKETVSVSLLRTINGVSDKIGGEVSVEDIEVSRSFSVAQGREIEGYATGKIKVKNETGETMSLIPRTRFQSASGVIYRIADRVSIPANGTKVVEVKADVLGKAGEAEQGHFTIPGLSESLQSVVYGDSLGPMVGGVRVAGILTQEDIDRAETELLVDLEQQKKVEIATGDQGISDDVTTIEWLKKEVKGEVGSEVDSFTIEGTVRVTMVLFDGSELDTLTRQAVFAKVPDDRRLHTVGDARYEVEKVDVIGKTATLKLLREGVVTIDPGSKVIDEKKFTSLTGEDISAYLESTALFDAWDVRIRPRWRSKTPSAPDRIRVILEIE